MPLLIDTYHTIVDREIWPRWVLTRGQIFLKLAMHATNVSEIPEWKSESTLCSDCPLFFCCLLCRSSFIYLVITCVLLDLSILECVSGLSALRVTEWVVCLQWEWACGPSTVKACRLFAVFVCGLCTLRVHGLSTLTENKWSVMAWKSLACLPWEWVVCLLQHYEIDYYYEIDVCLKDNREDY